MDSIRRLITTIANKKRKKRYSPETERVLKQARRNSESARNLRDSQEAYEQEALEVSQGPDWANPDAMAEWEELSAEAARLKKEADTHPSGLVEVLQAAVNEYGMPNRAKGILRKDAARKMLRNRRR